MSAKGMLLTVLATQLAEAVAKDETPEVGGCDLSAGMFGPNVSNWLRDLAEQLSSKDLKPLSPEQAAALRTVFTHYGDDPKVLALAVLLDVR